MDRLGGAHRPALRPRRLQRAPRSRAGAGGMGSGARDRARDGRVPAAARGERVGVAAGPAVPAVPGAGAGSRRCRRACGASRCSTGPRSPDRSGEPLFLDVRRGARPRPHADGEREVMPSVIGGRYGLSSKEFTPGMVAGVLRGARPRAAAGAASRSASTTTSRSTSLPYDPSLDIEPPRRVRAVFFGLGSDGTVGANKNTIKILGEERPARPGLLRLRLQEVGLADRLAPALRAAADPARPTWSRRRASSAATSSGMLERAEVLGPGGAGRDAAAQHPPRPGAGLGRAAAPGAGADPRQADRAAT